MRDRKLYKPYLEALTLAFVLLKIFGVVNWSWWVVLSPILIPLGILITLVAIIFIGGIVVQVQKRRYESSAYSEKNKDPRMRARSVVVHRCDDIGADSKTPSQTSREGRTSV
jgi:membrane protein YdbS with pleckstrin-like domain